MKTFTRLLFLFIFLLVPFEKKIDKIFFPLSSFLKQKWVQFPSYFDQNIWFFAVDFSLLALLVKGAFSFKRTHSFSLNHALYWLLAFIAITFLSLVLSSSSHYPLHYFRFFQLLLSCLAFLYVAISVEFKEPSLIKKLCWVICLIALFQSCLAIAQHFIQGPIGFRALGEMKHPEAFGKISFSVKNLGVMVRGQGTFVHANHLGGFLVVSMAATYYLLLKSSKKKLLIAAYFIQIFALLITFSRSAFFGWVLMSLLWFFFVFKQKRKIEQYTLKEREIKTHSSDEYSLKTVIIAFITCNVIVFGILFSKLVERGGYIQISLAQDNIRLMYQEIAWDMLQKHPLLGVGYNQFMLALTSYKEVLSQVGPYMVHNIYFLIGAETGFLGLFCFLGFMISVLSIAWKYRHDLEIITLAASWIALLWIGICDFYPFYDQSIRVLFLLIPATLIARASFLVSVHVVQQTENEKLKDI